MLAAPILPTSTFIGSRDLDQYRPAKDIEAFNALLPPAIEFVEGSSSGLFAVAEGKYQPINGTPKPSRPENDDLRSSKSASTPDKLAKQPPTSSAGAPPKSLYPFPIEVSWPQNAVKGCGLVNTGNTCFLNSALQCLLHTPPLLQVLLRHSKSDPCSVPKSAFCMSCSMRQLMTDCYKSNRPMVPYVIATKLHLIAKHLRRGRQEDSHEFLRYAIDALQKSCLSGHSPKIDHKLAETTWVHKIFGGRLRSRVTCLSCHYNSDTFDSMLDLSVDIYGVTTLRDALRKFVAVDHLKGADKYKCEKCKKHVTANKQFTVDEAPLVLTVHLKRFSPMGRKIGHPIRYEESLSLEPIMSEGQYGPTYSLFGVISHAGGGPNSGHYFAHIKDASGHWFEMNDESVVRTSGAPLGMKNAYMLFYIREKGQALEAAVGSFTKAAAKTPIVAGMKRRKRVDSDDEEEEPPTPPKRFIGPRLPSPPAATAAATPSPSVERGKSAGADPQAELLKRRIAEKASSTTLASPSKPSSALLSLSQYSDDDDDDMGEKLDQPKASTSSSSATAVADQLTVTSPAAKPSPSVTPVPTSSFYGTPSNKTSKKRKSLEPEEEDNTSGAYVRQPPPSSPRRHPLKRFAGNPFNRLSGANNLRGNTSPVQKYGRKNNRNNFNRRPRLF